MPVHDGMLGCLALNRDGSIMATALDKGTIVRLWSTDNHQPYMDLRRESDITEIQDLTFSTNGKYLALCGQENEITLYRVGENARQANDDGENKNDKGGFFGGIMGNKKVVGDKYFAKWAIKTFAKKKLAFSTDCKHVICATMDGNHH